VKLYRLLNCLRNDHLHNLVWIEGGLNFRSVARIFIITLVYELMRKINPNDTVYRCLESLIIALLKPFKKVGGGRDDDKTNII